MSCQANEGEVFFGLNLMDKMATAAEKAGADGIRCTDTDITAIKAAVSLPTIGIIKKHFVGSDVIITPTKAEVQRLIDLGTDVIAMDATDRLRPYGETLSELVRYARENGKGVELMADVSTTDEALYADALGFDYIGSTLRGYTEKTKGIMLPDCNFLSELVRSVKANVIAEGGIYELGQLENVLKTGVYAVVIGTAITRPYDITKRFLSVMKG